jgi:transposase
MNNSEPRLLRVETVADLPVIWALLHDIQFIPLANRLFPVPQNWKGTLTIGEVLAVWLLFIISQADHRLNHVQRWVDQHNGILTALIGRSPSLTDFHDDRLADLLDRLANSQDWAELEAELHRQTIRVYQFDAHPTIRIDTTTANSSTPVQSQDGMLQFGHSKDDPTRPQIKIASAILDPLGLPLITRVVPGNSADDPLYIPIIQATQQAIGAGNKTYVGDCKMSSLATRAHLASTHDFYLCPLSEVQLDTASRRALLQPVWDGTQALETVVPRGSDEATDPAEWVVRGFSVEVELHAEVGGKPISWMERRWLVLSRAYAESQGQKLDRRLAQAEVAIQNLATRKQGKKRLSEAELKKAAEARIAKDRLEGLLDFTVQTTTTSETKRAYGKRAESVVTTEVVTITTQRNDGAIGEAKRSMGWQVYATNQLTTDLTQTVWAYRGQYRIEEGWSRLKGSSLGLTPLYLQDETRIVGLVHLLSVGLRVLTLLEWKPREELRKRKKKLKGVYSGQEGRQTASPSAELLLGVLKTISVSVIEVNGERYVLMSPLSDTQKELLDLWGLPPNYYESLLDRFPKSTHNTSEP